MSASPQMLRKPEQMAPLPELVEFNPKPARGSIPSELPVSFVPMAAVGAESGRLDPTNVRTYADVKKGFTYFRDGDVLFAKITPCMENGKMAVARGLHNGIGFGSTEFHVLRPREGVDPNYVYHFVSSSVFRREAAHHMTGAVGQKRVPISFLQDSRIPRKPIDEQRRVVAEIEKQFSRLDGAVTSLRRVKANIKRYKAAVLKAAVEGRLVPTEASIARHDGQNYETGTELLRRVSQERRRQWSARGKYAEPLGPDTAALPALPEGWVWATADLLADFITKGTTPEASKLSNDSGDVQFLKVYNLTFDGSLNLSFKPTFVSHDTHSGELARSKVRPGDVLINIVGPPLGQVSVVPDHLVEANINQAIARIRPVPPLLPMFIAITLMCEDVMQWAVRRAKTTAGQSNLTLELCRALPVPLAPLAEQHRIVAEVDRRLSIVREVEAEVDANLKRAQALRQAVLTKVFTPPTHHHAPA